MPTTKLGEKISWKEFMIRWKNGIQNVSQLQQAFFGLIGYVLVLIGILIGLYATFITKSWWIFIILLGSLLLTGLSFLGGLQKYFGLKMINEIM